MPTAVHLDRQYQACVGSAAIARYVEENRGRRVELVAERIGESATSVTGNDTAEDISSLQTDRQVVYGPLVDRTLPGRLFLGLKRLLGDADSERFDVFERHYRVVALLTPILESIRDHITLQSGAPAAAIHVGRPVQFESRHAGGDSLAQARLSEALEHARIGVAEFYPEPVAATASFLWQAAPGGSGHALTVDFGGGTLDLAVVRFAGRQFEVLATEGRALGGDRIDQHIFRALLFPELGQGERWQREVEGRQIDTLFPFEEYEASLLSWPTTFLLNQNRTRTMVVDRLQRGGDGAVKFQRLLDLITFNYSHNCFQAIRKAKAELSEQAETSLDVPELNLRLLFTRERFDEILQPVLAQLQDSIDSVLRKAQLAPDQIDRVIRTGGSSEILAVRQLLENQFPNRVEGHDPFTSVAAGLAIANYYSGNPAQP